MKEKYLTHNRLRWLALGLGVKRYMLLTLIGVVLLNIAYFYIDDIIIGRIIFVIGMISVLAGLVIIIIKLWRIKPSGSSSMRSADELYKQIKLVGGPKIVAIGGGTGLSALLRALKSITTNISAVVTVADNGGNSGILRQEYDMLPPGDIRNCIIALSDVEDVMGTMLQYRFSEGKLKEYCLGNMMLVALSQMNDGFLKGIQMASKVLAVTGEVLPVTLDDVHLNARMKDGTIIEGENLVGQAQREHKDSIDEVWLNPENCNVLPEVIKAIEEADIILYGPGSLYTSILPNMLVPKMVGATRKSKAIKVYIANLMTQSGETQGYDVSDHVKAIEIHTKCKIFDYILANDNFRIEKDIRVRYDEETAQLVKFNHKELNEMGYHLICADLLHEEKGYVRHSMSNLAMSISKLWNQSNNG